MSVSPLVFSTKNIIMGFEAVALSSATRASLSCSRCRRSSICWFFTSFICSMARSPSGVAALSSPSMLAAMFMKMLPVTGCPLGISGNSRTNTGESKRESTSITPPRSPIFMMPNQSESTPVSPSEISKAVFDVSKVEFIMAGNTSVSPNTTSLKSAITNAIRKKAIQM